MISSVPGNMSYFKSVEGLFPLVRSVLDKKKEHYSCEQELVTLEEEIESLFDEVKREQPGIVQKIKDLVFLNIANKPVVHALLPKESQQCKVVCHAIDVVQNEKIKEKLKIALQAYTLAGMKYKDTIEDLQRLQCVIAEKKPNIITSLFVSSKKMAVYNTAIELCIYPYQQLQHLDNGFFGQEGPFLQMEDYLSSE